MDLHNTTKQTTVYSKGLEIPNGLFLNSTTGMLYIGDAGKKTVVECNTNGKLATDFMAYDTL